MKPSLFFEKINNIDKYLASLTVKKKIQITKISNESDDITITLQE